MLSRVPVVPVEKKTRIVLLVFAGEVGVSEAARWDNVCAQSIGSWKR